MHGLTQEQAAELGRKIQLVYEIHGRNLSDAAMALWVETLAPSMASTPTVTAEALKAACREKFFPGLGWVLERIGEANQRAARLGAQNTWQDRLQQERDEWERLTPDERESRQRAADDFFARLREKLGYGFDESAPERDGK